MRRSPKPRDRILQAAKEMRRTATPAEKALWADLRNRHLSGLKFYRFRNAEILNELERVLAQIVDAALTPVYRPQVDRQG